MALDQTRLMAALQAQGYSADEIDDILDRVEPVEEAEVVPEFKPQIFIRSDQVIELGEGEHAVKLPIKSIELDDLLNLSANIEYWYNYVGAISDDTRNKLSVGEISPMFLSHYLVDRAIKDKKSGHYTKFAVSIFEALANLFSTPGHEVSAEFVAGCFDQLPAAVRKYSEVNKQRFLALSDQLPESMTWQISSLITLISAIRNIVTESTPQRKSPTESTGGIKSGGSISSSSPSRKKPAASKKQKSAA